MQGKFVGGALSRAGLFFYVDFLPGLFPGIVQGRQELEVCLEGSSGCGLHERFYAIVPADGPALHDRGVHPPVAMDMLYRGAQNPGILRKVSLGERRHHAAPAGSRDT